MSFFDKDPEFLHTINIVAEGKIYKIYAYLDHYRELKMRTHEWSCDVSGCNQISNATIKVLYKAACAFVCEEHANLKKLMLDEFERLHE